MTEPIESVAVNRACQRQFGCHPVNPRGEKQSDGLARDPGLSFLAGLPRSPQRFKGSSGGPKGAKAQRPKGMDGLRPALPMPPSTQLLKSSGSLANTISFTAVKDLPHRAGQKRRALE